jgi:hypothetical protein
MSAKPPVRTEPVADFNAGDEVQVAERKKTSAAEDARRKEGLRKIMGDPDSRLWVRELLGFCGVWRNSFTGNSTTFFNEGQRNVGLKIHAELVRDHADALITMLKEGA